MYKITKAIHIWDERVGLYQSKLKSLDYKLLKLSNNSCNEHLLKFLLPHSPSETITECFPLNECYFENKYSWESY